MSDKTILLTKEEQIYFYQEAMYNERIKKVLPLVGEKAKDKYWLLFYSALLRACSEGRDFLGRKLRELKKYKDQYQILREGYELGIRSYQDLSMTPRDAQLEISQTEAILAFFDKLKDAVLFALSLKELPSGNDIDFWRAHIPLEVVEKINEEVLNKYEIKQRFELFCDECVVEKIFGQTSTSKEENHEL